MYIEQVFFYCSSYMFTYCNCNDSIHNKVKKQEQNV